MKYHGTQGFQEVNSRATKRGAILVLLGLAVVFSYFLYQRNKKSEQKITGVVIKLYRDTVSEQQTGRSSACAPVVDVVQTATSDTVKMISTGFFSMNSIHVGQKITATGRKNNWVVDSL